MPQIPTVVAPSLTPPLDMNPGQAGKPGQVIAGAADQFASAADFGFAVTERIKRAQDEGILLGAENQINADIEKYHSELANWTDYTNADQLKQQTADTLHQKYVDKYGNRPDLWRHIEPYLGRELNSYNSVVDTKAAQLTAQYNKGALFDSQLHTENEAANETTLDGKELLWAIQDAKTDMMVKNGSIRADEGEVAKKQLRSRTIAAEVDRAANPMNAPSIMEAEMDRLKEYEGKGYVDPKELEQMQDHLATAYERALNRSDRVDVSRQADAVLASMKNDPTNKDPETGEFDHLKAAKKVDDDPNIPTKVKKSVRTELEEEAGATQKLRNDNDQKMLDSLDPHVESGALSFAEITRRMNLAPGQANHIPRRVGDHLLTRAAQIQRENRTINMQERSFMRQERAEKSANIAQELLGQDGYITDKSELAPYLLKGLSRADANTVWAMKGIGASKEYSDSVKMMSASTVYPNTDAGHAQLINDLTTLRKTVEDKKLVGPDIVKAASDMLQQKEETQNHSIIKGLLDNIFPSIFGRPVTPPTPSTPAKTAAPQTFTDGGKTYRIPPDQVDAFKKDHPNAR